ncbi:MAG: murein L,D-transpeptidase catalytic domain family protein [Planctomycetes bacterium]|nr:murein L,D-transpeptidase catalytic domain family protein [Planctomycetota bacterium]
MFGPNTARAVAAAQESGHDLSAVAAAPAAASGGTVAPARPTPEVNASGRLRQLIREAEGVLASNRSGFRQDVFVVVDLARHSSEQRFFIVERSTGNVSGYRTSHGSGSDPRNTGRPQTFSNANNSHQTSVGVYRTAETYSGRHGYSLRLDGLSGTNSRARARAIVIHGANYVSEAGRRAGRSWGCFALDMRHRTAVIDRIKNGALLYAPDPNR